MSDGAPDRGARLRFVQLFQGGVGNQNVDTWDAHSNLVENHTLHAAESDLPIAGLLTDLKARGVQTDADFAAGHRPGP